MPSDSSQQYAWSFAPVEIIDGQVKFSRPLKRGRTEEDKERNRESGRRYRAKIKAEKAKKNPGIDLVDLRTAEGRRFKNKHGIVPIIHGSPTKATADKPFTNEGDTNNTHMNPIESSKPVQHRCFQSPGGSTLHKILGPTVCPAERDPYGTTVFRDVGLQYGDNTDMNLVEKTATGSFPCGSHVQTLGLGALCPQSPIPTVMPDLRPLDYHAIAHTIGPPNSSSFSVPFETPVSSAPVSPAPVQSASTALADSPQEVLTHDDIHQGLTPLSALSSLPGSPTCPSIQTAGSAEMTPPPQISTSLKPPQTIPARSGSPPITDFTTSVIGIELSPNTPSLQWPIGINTAVPFIPDPVDKKKNLLFLDEEAVRNFAQNSMKDPPPFISYVDHVMFHDSESLQKHIRSELCLGNTVVLQNYVPSRSLLFSEKNIISSRNISGHKKYSIHSSLQRVKDVENPQFSGGLKDFIESVFDHDKVCFILDVAAGTSKSPDIIYNIDDGFIARTSLNDIFGNDFFVLKDTYYTRNWDLLHGGGAHTFEHHDAEGYCTYVSVETGCKIWGIVRPTGYTDAKTRKELDMLNELFVREDFTGVPQSWDLPWVKDGGLVFAIPARPGDLIVMPPGTWHLVYTPVRTVATGGHIFLYDTMHLTEMSQKFDNKHAREVTNTTHVSALETICLMAINLIRLDGLVIGRKPLIALCRMVVFYEEYISDTGEGLQTKMVHKLGRKSDTVLLAKIVAEYMDNFFELGVKRGDFLFQGRSWMDPGPNIDLTSAQIEWDGTPLRPHSGGSPSTTISIRDIINQNWQPQSQREKRSQRRQSRRK